jgi:thiol-disulfide isomerase/thioredoxin
LVRFLRLAALVAGLAVIAGLSAYGLHRNSDAATEAVRQLTEDTLIGADGAPLNIASLRGKVVLVNFWATWCTPCKEEIPLLAQMQSDLGGSGLQIVGIAIDNPDKVRQFIPSSPINYTVAVASMDALNLIRGLGDDAGALPYSVILDRSGKLVASKLGAYHREELRSTLDPLLR